MPLGEYLTGVLFYVPTLGAGLAAAHLVVSRRYGHLPPLARCLAYMVLATAATVLSSVLPAALGILSRPSALVASVGLLAASSLVPRSTAPASSEPEPSPPRSRPLSAVIATVAAAAIAVYTAALVRLLATQPITDIDMLGFHLPGVARFIQTGTLWRVDQFLPGFATAQYPNNGDFLLLSVILPWHDLAFVRFVPIPFYLLTGVGVYALGLELRAPRAAAATMAAAALTVPAFSLLALQGLPDAIAMATMSVGLVFLLRHARSRRTCELALAGLSLGLSFGTKWYGATSVAIVCVIWLAARLVARRSRPRVLRDSAALAGTILVGGGLWVVRNLIESGNPIYPKAVSPLGLHLFSGSHGDVIDQYGYTIANYLGNLHVLRTYIYPAFKLRAGFTAVVLVLGLVIAAAIAGRQIRQRPRRGPTPVFVLGLALATLGICAEYLITPGSAYGLRNMPSQALVNVRWLMPAILIAAALGARAVLELGRAGPVLELAALAGLLDGIHLGLSVPVSTAVLVALALAGLTAAAWLARRWAAGGHRYAWRSPHRARAVVAVTAGAIVALVALARADQQRFDRHTYASYDPTLAWIVAHAPAGHRIGVTGVWSTSGLTPTLPAFGPRLGNRVAYVGDPAVHSLHLPASQGSFDAELLRGRYDLLLIGLQDPAHTDVWARAAGYRLVAQSDRLALYAAPA